MSRTPLIPKVRSHSKARNWLLFIQTTPPGSSNPQYIVSSQTTSVCSDSEQSVASQCSFIVQPAENADNELFKMLGEEDRPDRPSFLDLTGQSGSTPMVPRKPRFQFSGKFPSLPSTRILRITFYQWELRCLLYVFRSSF